MGVLVGAGVGVGVSVGTVCTVSVTVAVVSDVPISKEHALNTIDAISIAGITIQRRLLLLLNTFKYCSLPRESQNQYQVSVILQTDRNWITSHQANVPVSSAQ